MYCKYCGNKLGDNDSFCMKCGKKTELQPSCNESSEPPVNSEKTQNRKILEKEKKPKKRSKKLVWLVVIVLLLAFAISILVHFKSSYSNEASSDTYAEIEYNLEDYHEDADVYYGRMTDELQSTKISDANNIQSEKEFCDEISARGFELSNMFYVYDMDGNIYDEETVSPDSDEKRPVLEAYVCLEDDTIWHIYELNGEFLAYPVTYLSENDCDKEIIVSESSEIVCYDNIKKSFYRFAPKDDVASVIVVEKITAAALSKLNISEEVAAE